MRGVADQQARLPDGAILRGRSAACGRAEPERIETARTADRDTLDRLHRAHHLRCSESDVATQRLKLDTTHRHTDSQTRALKVHSGIV